MAGAIKWQTAHQSPINVPPTDAMKVAWPSWTAAQKADLNQAYLDAFAWAAGGAAQVPMVPPGVSDKPQNLDPFLAVDTSPRLYLAQDAMWKLFTAHVGFSLFLELTQQVPWSLTAYDDASLRVLLDSSSMAWNVGPMGGTPAAYSFGLDPWHVPAQVADNLPQTAFAAPTWTFPFLRDAGCLGEQFLAGLPLIRIIHGKGTGALRAAIREELSSHPLVRRLETAGPREGGEGVTVAILAG